MEMVNNLYQLVLEIIMHSSGSAGSFVFYVVFFIFTVYHFFIFSVYHYIGIVTLCFSLYYICKTYNKNYDNLPFRFTDFL